MTSRAKVVFTVKETSTGQPWIAFEYLAPFSSMPPGLFGFDLEQDISISKAQDIAEFMNKMLESFSHTP